MPVNHVIPVSLIQLKSPPNKKGIIDKNNEKELTCGRLKLFWREVIKPGLDPGLHFTTLTLSIQY